MKFTRLFCIGLIFASFLSLVGCSTYCPYCSVKHDNKQHVVRYAK